MKIIKSFLIGFLIHSCISEPLGCINCAKTKTDLPVAQLRQLRYEYLKNQILKKLHLTEAPKTNLPKPPLKSLLVIAEMAENEAVLETEDRSKRESVVIYPKNENLTCPENKSDSCCRFEFVVPESLSLDNFVSAEVWFYKDRAKFIRVYQVIADNLGNLTRTYELDNTAIEKSAGAWVKYNIFSDIIRSYFATEDTLTLEIIGCSNETVQNSTNLVDTDSDSAIRRIGDEKPFLVIRSEKSEELTRKKRGSSCLESSSSCCKENFFLNFSEIGWDNWILHPDGYQANFCRGRCFNDLSNTRFYHSAVLLSYIRDNKDIAEEIGLNMCCTPSVMAPVTIIYRNEEGFIYHKSIENMKVESCDCA